MESKIQILENIYFDEKNPNSFASANKLYLAAKKIDNDITRDFVKRWLSSRFEYSLFKQPRHTFKRNKVLASFINEYWQIDILDYANISRFNNGFKYLINIIDVFSKFLICIPTKTKTMFEITYKFNILFSKVKPINLQSDRGREFNNRDFKLLCQHNNVNYFTTENQTTKCAVVERVNRTIRLRITKYMAHHGTNRYIDALPDIIRSYNYSIHRSINMSPIQVNLKNENKVFKKLYGVDTFLELLKSDRGKKSFNENDEVRLKFDKKKMDRGHDQMWSDMVYKIRNVYDKFSKPQYSVQYGNEILKRRYYPEELQSIQVDKNTFWPIEKILRYRKNNNQVEALVRFKGHNYESDQWIPMDQVQKL